jgi:hypothetical protein
MMQHISPPENEMHSATPREVVQHIDDIEIPVIEITAGWSAESVQTRKDCDDAFAYLMSACAGIEFQIDTELTKPKNFQDVMWMAKAKCALKYKKAALQIVQQRRSIIAETERRAWQDSRDRKLLEYIRGAVPNQQFMNWVDESGIVASLGAEGDVA